MRPKLLRRTGFGFVVAFLGMFGCNGIGCEGCGGAQRGFPTHPVIGPEGGVMPPSDGGVAVKGGFNNCPTASVQVAPQMVRVGQTLMVVGQGSDIDPKDTVLQYKWTATSGYFGDDGEQQTTFTCLVAGPVTITLTVTDGSCNTTATAPVFCVAIRDAGDDAGGSGGTTGTGGADGGDGGGGVVNTCPASEPTRGGPECPTCVAANCKLDPAPAGSDGCCAQASTADQLLCLAAYACFSANAATCTSQGDPNNCFCGTANFNTCWSVQGAANGPCVNETIAAAKTADLAQVLNRFISPAFPIGRAVNLLQCQGGLCQTECKLP
jgi:hypothetical protein